MAEIVLVHGIGQEQQGQRSLEALWLPALADGIAAAGDEQTADRIWSSNRTSTPGISVRMAAYGDLFRDADAQGAGGADDAVADDAELAGEIAREWLQRGADRGDSATRGVAARELGYLSDDLEPMGAGHELARKLLVAVARVPWFASASMAVAQRVVNSSLAQVTRYLTDPQLNEAIRARVAAHIGPETRAVIGHSLGSVVAYEVVAALRPDLPILITLGSPLGLDTIIYQRVKPQPPTCPAGTALWVNVADRDDLVAADPQIATRFPMPESTHGAFEAGWLEDHSVDNGPSPHSAEFYLRKAVVGRHLSAVLGDRR